MPTTTRPEGALLLLNAPPFEKDRVVKRRALLKVELEQRLSAVRSDGSIVVVVVDVTDVGEKVFVASAA